MANGTIAFDTLQTSGQITGTAKSLDTDYVVNGSAKAWVYGDSTAALEDSFNISTGTDNGTGDYTYTLSNAFVSGANQCQINSARAGSGVFRCAIVNNDRITSSVLAVFLENTSSTLVDERHNVSSDGVLA